MFSFSENSPVINYPKTGCQVNINRLVNYSPPFWRHIKHDDVKWGVARDRRTVLATGRRLSPGSRYGINSRESRHATEQSGLIWSVRIRYACDLDAQSRHKARIIYSMCVVKTFLSILIRTRITDHLDAAMMIARLLANRIHISPGYGALGHWRKAWLTSDPGKSHPRWERRYHTTRRFRSQSSIIDKIPRNKWFPLIRDRDKEGGWRKH